MTSRELNNKKRIKTEETFYHHNVLTASAYTNAPNIDKEDTETFVSLKDEGGTFFGVTIEKDGEKYEIENIDALHINLSGNGEAFTIIEALRFAVNSLEKQLKYNTKNK